MKVILNGLNVEVVTEAAAERATVVVCGPISYFADDVHSHCSSCGTAIVHRPSVPLLPPKICVECALAMVGPKQ